MNPVQNFCVWQTRHANLGKWQPATQAAARSGGGCSCLLRLPSQLQLLHPFPANVPSLSWTILQVSLCFSLFFLLVFTWGWADAFRLSGVHFSGAFSYPCLGFVSHAVLLWDSFRLFKYFRSHAGDTQAPRGSHTGGSNTRKQRETREMLQRGLDLCYLRGEA